LNLVEFPLAVLSTAAPREKTLEFEELKRIDGEPVRQKLTITGSDKYGLPAANHHKLLVALLQLFYEQADFENPRVEFTRYQLLKKAGWRDEGRYYKMARNALCIWKGTNLYYENAWWVDGKFKTKGFSIIDDFELYEKGQQAGRRTKREQEQDPSYVVFGSVIVEEFRKARTKGLDYDYFLRLKYPISRQLYRYLDKWFWYDDVFRHPDIGVFACEKIGLSRNYDRANQKRLLDKGLSELTESGFLRKGTFAKRYTRSGGIELWRNGGKSIVPPKPQRSPLELELEKRGVSPGLSNPTCAGNLVKKYDHELVAAKIEVLDWLLQRNDLRATKNPPGYLVDSIRHGWPNPPGFESKVEQVSAKFNQKQTPQMTPTAINSVKENWRKEEAAERLKFKKFLQTLHERGTYEAFVQESLASGPFEKHYHSHRSNNQTGLADKWLFAAMRAHWAKRYER